MEEKHMNIHLYANFVFVILVINNTFLFIRIILDLT